MIRAHLTIKQQGTFGTKLSIRKLTFRNKDEIYLYKGVVKTIEGSEVTNIVIL